MPDHELVTPSDPTEWKAYHDIRRQVLFEARGEFGTYDENHPDERAVGNHPKLLIYRGDPVGTIRIDIDGTTAILRRVAIRADAQRHGHGRILLLLAQRFATENGCVKLASFVAPDAVGFYRSFGFDIERDSAVGPSGRKSVYMIKGL